MCSVSLRRCLGAALRGALHVPRQHAELAWTDGCHRAASTGRRDFYQNLNEQHLANELKNLSMSAQGGTPDTADFQPRVPFKPHRRHTPVFQSDPEHAPRSSSSDFKGGDFVSSAKTKPWLHYESMRGEAYTEKSGRPRWQDLTHGEAQRMQEMFMRKRMLDRKILWMKTQHLPNPQKDAKMEMRRRENDEQRAEGDMYPVPFMEKDNNMKQFASMVSDTQRDELESRFRSRIRQSKLENAQIVKANVPDVGDFITDPIKRHVHRRLLRQRSKMYGPLEESLTSNSAQVLHEFLKGVAVSIVRIRAKSPRQTQELVYNLTSDHDPAWVQQQLNVLAPKLRSNLALKANMGQTPNIRFVPQTPLQNMRRAHLLRFARKIQEETPVGSKTGLASAGGTIVPHGGKKRRGSKQDKLDLPPQ